MDTLFQRFSSPMKNFQFGSTQFQVNHEPTNPLFLPTTPEHPTDSGFSNPGSDGDSFDMSDYNHSVIKYISDILLEEDLEDKPCMLQNCLALQAAEKSFYDVLNPKDPPSPDQPPHPVYQSFEHSDDDSSQSYSSNDSMAAKADSVFDSSETLLVSNSTSGNFGGVGEAGNLVPNLKHGIIDLERYQLVPPGDNTLRRNSAPEPENDGNISANRLKGKKNHQREDGDYADGGRSNKQSAALGDDTEPQEMFDRVLLCHVNHTHASCIRDKPLSSEGSEKLQPKKQSKGSKTTRLKKQNNYQEVVDISTLLTQCAQATASYDQRSASEVLKQIRKHSSPSGDATERLAHYFADGLEARLVGARTPSYSPLLSIQTPAAEILKAHQMYVNYCPFKYMLHFFSNRTIIKLAEKATRLHIVDFGISYGFQWPCLIQRLSERNGGPPSIRLTAIELPQPGFRPTERVEETGRRLKKYAARFNVQFEYKVFAQKWETIQLEDLKIDRNELTVVNCMHRLKHIPDETVVVSSPRDLVLKLIRRINPDLFIHGVVNGTYNSPFFVTRFKEALYHFSAMFDMFEATIPREDEQRMMFEKAIYGKDIMNVVACEGLERVERPETYKQWQVRYHRAGFKQVPLDQELLKRVKIMLKAMHYHDDFRIDEDGDWMLQGWKGRIIFGLAFWKPA